MTAFYMVSKALICSWCIIALNSISPKSVLSQLVGLSCPSTSSYDPNANAAYRANLNVLFSDLSSNSSRTNGFYNSSAGLNNDKVYGLFLCRGDVGSDACEGCVTTAITEVQELCPGGKTAITWYDLCMLRYSNQSIFPRDERTHGVAVPNTENATHPDIFSRLLENMLVKTAHRAADDSSGKRFAAHEFWSELGKFEDVFVLAQCTPDLSAFDCSECLSDAIRQIQTQSLGYRRGARLLYPCCNIRFEVYQFFGNSETQATTPPLEVYSPPKTTAPASNHPTTPAGPTSADSGRKHFSLGVFIAIALGIIVSVMPFIVAFLFLRKRSRKLGNALAMAAVGKGFSTDNESLQYNLSEIQAATNNFSADQKIGEGGFGRVHKGTLPDGQEIAVKRLARLSVRGLEEFKNEIGLVSKLQHKNLVRLLGFCFQEEEMILVYEFVLNRSLDYFLFDPEKQWMLDWSKRYKIIGGIARGLVYLHEDSRLRIIHRDLKASNILLDYNMTPKIADFGMAKIFGVDQAEGNTNRIAGTFGYMAPEYAMHGQFSMKSDVFSFGVIMLEIVSGKKNSRFYQSDRAEDLLSFAWKLWRDCAALDLLDPSMEDSYVKDEVIHCIHIGLLCVQEDAEQRPTMVSVVHMLNSVGVALPSPRPPPFFIRKRTESTAIVLGSDQSISNTLPHSVNEASISELIPR